MSIIYLFFLDIGPELFDSFYILYWTPVEYDWQKQITQIILGIWDAKDEDINENTTNENEKKSKNNFLS